MRIGIEGLSLLFHRTGTSTYAHELVQHLRRLNWGDTVILFARNQHNAGGSYHGISYAERAANLLYRDYRLPNELAEKRIDIYHSPRDMGLPPPGRLPCPSVVTLHDIILVRLACDYYGPRRARFYASRLLSRIRAADHILTVSEFSRRDILDWTGLPAEKVDVVYNGVSEKFTPVDDEAELDRVRERYGLPPRYILCVGSTEPRKNVRRAIEAFAGLRRLEAGVALVVTGVDYCRVRPEEAFSGLPLDGVLFAGYVEDDDMPALLSAAELLFFPSLYEGFGLPPLEAMACGTPVLTSNRTSIPEVVQDAAMLVDPEKPDEMAAGLEMLLGSASLREELIEKGKQRAAYFKWEKAALETRKIYQKVIEKSAG
jgi:glycosyltransferase involved in cell wall biosynthesis